MAQVLILGGGFGGVAAAVSLSKRLASDDRIVLVDRRGEFYFGFRKSWAFLGLAPMAEGKRPLRALEQHGIEFRQGTIDSLDPISRSATVDGQTLEADAMVVALGAHANPDLTPGLTEFGLNFYDPAKIEQAAAKLDDFTGGRVAIVIPTAPYPCPPAPYEIAMLLGEFFDDKAIEAEIHVYSPKPMSLPVLGEVGCSVLESRLSDRGILFHPLHALEEIQDGKVRFETSVGRYELLIAIPGHTGPQVIVESGLAGDSGWAKVDARTLETGYEGVYAIGDCVSIPLADGKVLPKAGVFAEAHARVVAERIARVLDKDSATATYDGSGHCFLETGGGEAMLVRGNFLSEPAPLVELFESSKEHYEAKLEWERTTLSEWFPNQD